MGKQVRTVKGRRSPGSQLHESEGPPSSIPYMPTTKWHRTGVASTTQLRGRSAEPPTCCWSIPGSRSKTGSPRSSIEGDPQGPNIHTDMAPSMLFAASCC